MPNAPSNATLPAEDVQESLYELLEYLDLLQLRSPRLRSTDGIDPFISRYSVPQTPGEKDLQTHNVRILEWKGLISAQWMMILLNQLMYVLSLLTPSFLLPVRCCREHALTIEQTAISTVRHKQHVYAEPVVGIDCH